MSKFQMAALFSFFTILLASCGGQDEEQSSEVTDDDSTESDAPVEEESEAGGELTMAYSTQPETLDAQLTTATATRDIARHIFETLVTVNSNYEVTPMLAESYEESEDGETITFHLREGVPFHNGEEMTADDVVASMERWQELSALGQSNLEGATFTAEDEYTVVLEVVEASSVLMFVLAEIGQFAAIMPEEIIDEAEATGVTEYIGTGPFELVEWQQDQHVHLQKFDDYQPSSEPTDGLSGEKEALVDDLYFTFVTDPSTRLSGLQTNEYDMVHQVPYDNAEQLEADPNIDTYVEYSGLEALIFNKQEGMFTDATMRQAVNAAIDKDAAMTAAFVSEEYYDLDPGIMLPDQVEWYTEAGAEYYNQNDNERAQELLDEAGYDGEEVTILTTREYDHHYNVGVVTQQQLEQLGMNTDLQVVEWAALLQQREDPSAYDIFITSFATRPTPHQYPVLDTRAQWPGWTDNTDFDNLLDEISAQNTQEEALAVFEELQELFYEDVPIVNIGKYSSITGMQSNVEGFDELVGPILWNVSNSE